MKYGVLITEKKEYEMLTELMGKLNHRRDDIYQASIEKLSSELKSAKKVSNENIPHDVVRLKATVKIKLPDGQIRTLQIVSPANSNMELNKISVLAPMSLALYGYAAGDKVQWMFPSGMKTIQILKVDQMKNELKTLQS